MTPELKKLWTDALRSGEYKQAQQYLKDDTGYCCLGVLAHICAPTINSMDGIQVDEDYGNLEVQDQHGNWHVGDLPERVLYNLGLEQEDQLELITRNDAGESFDSIAAWIDLKIQPPPT